MPFFSRCPTRDSLMRAALCLAALLFAGATLSAQSTPGPLPVPASGSPPAASSTAKPDAAAPSAPKIDHGASHDEHDGMAVIAVPYTDIERSKEKFGKANPLAAGILPIEVTMRNNTPHPIHINLTTVQLEVNIRDERQDVDWLTPVEVANAIVHPEGPPAPKQRRVPVVGVPLPGKDKKVEKLAEMLKPLTLDADVIPPMGSIHGFMYFNMSHELTLVPDSSLYLPDVVFLPSNKPLIFFEVPLGSGPAL
jgi:hypothetical protein